MSIRLRGFFRCINGFRRIVQILFRIYRHFNPYTAPKRGKKTVRSETSYENQVYVRAPEVPVSGKMKRKPTLAGSRCQEQKLISGVRFREAVSCSCSAFREFRSRQQPPGQAAQLQTRAIGQPSGVSSLSFCRKRCFDLSEPRPFRSP